MKKTLATLVFTFLATVATAQTATPASKLGWTEVGQAATVASSATYNIYVNAAATPVVMTGVTCVAGSPTSNADCQGNFPALTPGTYNITLTQVISGAESPKSSPLSVTFVVVVTPTGLRVIG